jgi:hypothetical protein
MVGILAMLRWLVYWPCYDGWCAGRVTTVGVLAMLRQLVCWPCYDGWCTDHVITYTKYTNVSVYNTTIYFIYIK